MARPKTLQMAVPRVPCSRLARPRMLSAAMRPWRLAGPARGIRPGRPGRSPAPPRRRPRPRCRDRWCACARPRGCRPWSPGPGPRRGPGRSPGRTPTARRARAQVTVRVRESCHQASAGRLKAVHRGPRRRSTPWRPVPRGGARHLGVRHGHDLVQLLHQHHLQAPLPEGLGHLQADVAAAHHQRPARALHGLAGWRPCRPCCAG